MFHCVVGLRPFVIMCDRIIPTSLVLFVPGDLGPLSTIKVRMGCWLFEYHLSEIPA